MKPTKHILLLAALLLGSITASAEVITTISQLSNTQLYYFSLPHHSGGTLSWAIAEGDPKLKSNKEVDIVPDANDVCQHFALISHDGGVTRYLYHAAEKKFIGKNGLLSSTPTDAIYFKDGAYENTFVAYFDNQHYVNVNAHKNVDINNWSTADGGNSYVILPVGDFDATDALLAFTAGKISEAEEYAANVGTKVGYYTEESVAALNSVIVAAKESLKHGGAYDEAQLQEAINALEIVQPSEEKCYHIMSAMPPTAEYSRRLMFVSEMGGMQFCAEYGENTLFKFINAGEGKYYLYNVKSNTYLSTARRTGEGGNEAKAKRVEDAKAVTIANMGWKNIVNITPEEGDMLNVWEAEKRIGGWNDDYCFSNSAWIITEAIAGITLSQLSARLLVGESMDLTFTLSPNDADANLVTWSSSNPNIVAVDNTGKVNAIAPGRATITTTANDGSGVTASCEVVVYWGKCSSPDIRYIDGQVKITCDTEGVEFHSNVVVDNAHEYEGEAFDLTATYTITAYATKGDYLDSETTTVTICWVDCSEEHVGEGDETGILTIPAQPVLIHTQGGVITLSGLAEGTAVVVYDLDGTQLGTATATGGTATITTNLTTGSVAVVQIGERSVMVAIK